MIWVYRRTVYCTFFSASPWIPLVVTPMVYSCDLNTVFSQAGLLQTVIFMFMCVYINTHSIITVLYLCSQRCGLRAVDLPPVLCCPFPFQDGLSWSSSLQLLHSMKQCCSGWWIFSKIFSSYLVVNPWQSMSIPLNPFHRGTSQCNPPTHQLTLEIFRLQGCGSSWQWTIISAISFTKKWAVSKDAVGQGSSHELHSYTKLFFCKYLGFSESVTWECPFTNHYFGVTF